MNKHHTSCTDIWEEGNELLTVQRNFLMCWHETFMTYETGVTNNWFTLQQSVFRRVRKIAKSKYITFVMLSVCPHGTTLLTMEGISWNLIFENFSKICRRKFKFHQNRTKITDTSHEDLCTFLISGWILLRMRNVSYRFAEKIKTHISCSVTSLPKIVPLMW